MSDPVSVAKGHISALEDELKSDDYRGPEWDMHKQLLRAAHNTTNGGSGDLRVLSENLGMLTATYVQDRIRQPEQIRKAFSDLHGDICPVVPLVKPGPDGKPVMPWDQAKTDQSAFSFSLKDGVSARGPIAKFVAVLVIAAVFVAYLQIMQNKAARQAGEEAVTALTKSLIERDMVSGCDSEKQDGE